MVSVLALWLPILVAAVFVFIVSSIMHMVFSYHNSDFGGVPAEDEVRLMYRKFRRGWRFGIESFFFQEGLGEVYEVAKYAELRVDPSGEAVLVDLRSEGLGVLDTRAGEAAGDGAAGNR